MLLLSMPSIALIIFTTLFDDSRPPSHVKMDLRHLLLATSSCRPKNVLMSPQSHSAGPRLGRFETHDAAAREALDVCVAASRGSESTGTGAANVAQDQLSSGARLSEGMRPLPDGLIDRPSRLSQDR
jgi:hypothetical protein